MLVPTSAMSQPSRAPTSPKVNRFLCVVDIHEGHALRGSSIVIHAVSSGGRGGSKSTTTSDSGGTSSQDGRDSIGRKASSARSPVVNLEISASRPARAARQNDTTEFSTRARMSSSCEVAGLARDGLRVDARPQAIAEAARRGRRNCRRTITGRLNGWGARNSRIEAEVALELGTLAPVPRRGPLRVHPAPHARVHEGESGGDDTENCREWCMILGVAGRRSRSEIEGHRGQSGYALDDSGRVPSRFQSHQVSRSRSTRLDSPRRFADTPSGLARHHLAPEQ